MLMLHGLAQSGDYFASKTRGFRETMNSLGYELFYATAPNSYSPADVGETSESTISSFKGDAPSTGDGNVLAWLESDYTGHSYTIPDSTLSYIRSLVLTKGPFSGIVGFSQGAGLAGYLVTDFTGILGLDNLATNEPQFAIFFSGFRLLPKKYSAQYERSPITIKTLHVHGKLDTVTEFSRVETLYHACSEESRTLLTHQGGHYVPNSRSFLNQLRDWLT